MILIIIRYIKIFFKPKKNSKLILIICALGFYFCISIVSFVNTIPILNFLACVVGIFALTCAFEGKILKKILVTFSVAILNAVCDIISYMILANLYQNMQINISYVFTILLILICEQTVSCIMRNRQNTYVTPDNLGILILIPFCSVIVLYCVTASKVQKTTEITIAVCVLIINILVFYIYQKMLDNYLSQMTCKILEERSQAYANEIQIMSHTQRKIQALQHDMKHHIIELQGLAKSGKSDEIEAYLNNMETAVSITKEYVCSGNYQIDSLLNYLLQEANEQLNDVQIQINIPQEMELNTFKFNIIMGNLLENAIEAANHSLEKQLQMVIRMEQGLLFIKIENSYEGEIKKKGDAFITTKANTQNHGLGLKNVKELVEEEDGTFSVEVTEHLFKVEVMMYL